MGTGYSGYSDPKTANLAAKIAPPEPTKNFHVSKDPELYEGKAKITGTFIKPANKILDLAEAVSDDVFSSVQVGATGVATLNPNVTVIPTTSDLTGVLATADIISFLTIDTKYIIKSITALDITLTYGLNDILTPASAIMKCTKTAESPIDSRSFRVNSMVGNSVNIYCIDGVRTHKWTVLATLGTFLDIDKILAKINETSRAFSKEQIFTADPTPLPISVLSDTAAGQKLVIFDQPITGLINPDDYVSFGENESFYQIDTLASMSSIMLKTNLAKKITAGTNVFKKLVSPYQFSDYQTESLINFSGKEPSTDIKGYKIYMKESLQTENSKGTIVKTVTKDDAALIDYNDGTTDIIFYASDDTLNGRNMYLGITSYDSEMPTANESAGDLNARVVSLPSAIDVVSVAVDIDVKTALVTYGKITTGAKNPHMLEMMGNNLTEYSANGGFDIYVKAFSVLDMADGFYTAVDVNNGKVVHPSIKKDDFVEVRDSVSRHIWVAQAVVNGSVDLNDSVKTYGDAAISYLSAHKSINMTSKVAAINKNTDSVLPLTSDPTPAKQYLTEYQNTFTVTGLAANTEYCVVMESIDTQITYEKI